MGVSVISQVTVMVTESCDLKKDIEELKTNDIIQYSNRILIS